MRRDNMPLQTSVIYRDLMYCAVHALLKMKNWISENMQSNFI